MPAAPPNGRSDPARRPSAAQLALAAGTLALALALGAWQEHRRGDDTAARAATLAAGPGAGVVALPLADPAGRPVALTRLGTPAVVMVVSTTCGVCKAALADFGRVAAGRPLAGLWILTLEGAAEGPALTARADVRGPHHVGPAAPAQAVYATTQIAGTPTFVALDRAGHVARVLPGYPGLDAMRGWLSVMLGTSDAVH